MSRLRRTTGRSPIAKLRMSVNFASNGAHIIYVTKVTLIRSMPAIAYLSLYSMSALYNGLQRDTHPRQIATNGQVEDELELGIERRWREPYRGRTRSRLTRPPHGQVARGEAVDVEGDALRRPPQPYRHLQLTHTHKAQRGVIDIPPIMSMFWSQSGNRPS